LIAAFFICRDSIGDNAYRAECADSLEIIPDQKMISDHNLINRRDENMNFFVQRFPVSHIGDFPVSHIGDIGNDSIFVLHMAPG